MIPVWASSAWADYVWWKKNNPALHKRINKLIESSEKDPFQGIGKPEPLRHELAGYWSRRINEEHRLVYKVVGKKIFIAACRYHYD